VSSGEPPRVAITAIGRASVATLVFRASGQLRVAAIVKATFSMVQDRAMERAQPEPIFTADQHRDGDPTKSVIAASDLVPYRPRADVVLQGHARAPLGQPTPRLGVRMMLARGPQVVLDKRLGVQGGRDASGQINGPMPFESIPLIYELAASAAENPIGLPERGRNWPSVVDAWYRARAVGFGPIADTWPARRGLLHDAAILKATVADYAADFPWAFFNAAPEDQRLDRIVGDEWVGFEGMNASIPRVQSCLPGVRGAARVYGPRAEQAQGQPISLVADTMAIDADQMLVSVVWRGSFGVASEAELAALHVFAGVETAAEPLAFPATYVPPRPARGSAPPPAPAPSAPVSVRPQARPSAPPPQAPAQRDRKPGARTLAVVDGDLPPSRPATPFDGRVTRPQEAPVSRPPQSVQAPAAPPPRPPTHPGTQMLSAEVANAIAAHAATPFEARRPPTNPGLASTLPIEDATLPPQPGISLKAATPFEARAAGAAPPNPPPPAAPAPAPSRPVTRPDLSSTLPIEDGTLPPQPGISLETATPFEARPQSIPKPAAPAPPPQRSPTRPGTQTLSLDAMMELAAKAKGAAMPFVPTAPEPPREPPARPLPVATPFDHPDGASAIHAPVPPTPGAETVDMEPIHVAPVSLAAPVQQARRPSIGESIAQGLAPREPAPTLRTARERSATDPAPIASAPSLAPLDLLDLPTEEPKTLGAHFLAAMARAQRRGGAETLAR
jgi:hypothetical protein